MLNWNAIKHWLLCDGHLGGPIVAEGRWRLRCSRCGYLTAGITVEKEQR
jgi:hypothetical protein